MEIFNLIAGICSIISLFISLYVASKVININAVITQDASNSKSNQFQFGSNNNAAGRDMSGK